MELSYILADSHASKRFV